MSSAPDNTKAAGEAPAARLTPLAETCEYCGSDQLEWRKCKLVCRTCHQINKSCADL